MQYFSIIIVLETWEKMIIEAGCLRACSPLIFGRALYKLGLANNLSSHTVLRIVFKDVH